MKLNYLITQSLLLKWFRHHGVRSMQQIRVACKNLNDSYSLQSKHPIYILFFPLVRKGFVEFMGQGKYQPAPPVIIHSKKHRILTALNFTDFQIVHIQKDIMELPDLFGVCRFKSCCQNLKKISIELGINYTENNIAQVLSQFPRLKDIISQLQQVEVTSNSYHFFDVFRHSWKYAGGHFYSGIHKLHNDAQQFYFRMNENVWLKIPSHEINPDSRYICESYQALLQKETPFIFYRKKEKHLVIRRNISIPILLDRILRIPSLHLMDGMFENKKEQVYQNISISAFKQLNRIFSNGIIML